MGLVWKFFIFIAAVVAILCQMETDHNKWIATKTIVLKANIEDTFNFITSVDYVEKWFSFVSHLKEADGRPLGLNKKFYAIYDLPFWGEYQLVYRITEYKIENRIVIEGGNILLPHIGLHFVKINESETKLSISISYMRSSYFFQYFIGPLLYFFTKQKLQHSLFLLRMVFPY